MTETSSTNAISTNSMGAGIIAQALGSLGIKSTAEIDRVAREFEQMTLSQLLSYTNTDNDMTDSLFGGGAGERAFQPMLMDEYAKGIANGGGIGIAAAVKSEMLKLQEAAQNIRGIINGING